MQASAAPPDTAASLFTLLMKSLFISITALCLVSTAVAQERTPLKDSKDKISYSIGLDIGSTLKRQKVDVNADAISAGLKDAISGAKPLMSDEEVKQTMTAFSKYFMEKQAAATKEAAQKNAAAGEKFLAENKNKPGVKTTASGLQYKVVKEGTGPTPKSSDTVVTNYRGTLLNGTEFDSSYKRGQPATFPVSGVIKGWTEALQLMKVGSKYQIYVPAALAYGPRAAGQDIGPNETLIFDIELEGIQPSAESSPSAALTPSAGRSPSAARSPSATPPQ